MNEFKVFIERNAKTITHLNISQEFTRNDATDVFKHMLTIISNLKNLVHLKIKSDFTFNDNSFTEQLSQISLNCNQLKGLKIGCNVKEDHNCDHISALRQFKRLKRLHLNLWTPNTDDLGQILFFPIKTLKWFSQLTDLARYPLIDSFILNNYPKHFSQILTSIYRNSSL